MEFVKRNFPEYKNSEYSEIIRKQKNSPDYSGVIFLV